VGQYRISIAINTMHKNHLPSHNSNQSEEETINQFNNHRKPT